MTDDGRHATSRAPETLAVHAGAGTGRADRSGRAADVPDERPTPRRPSGGRPGGTSTPVQPEWPTRERLERAVAARSKVGTGRLCVTDRPSPRRSPSWRPGEGHPGRRRRSTAAPGGIWNRWPAGRRRDDPLPRLRRVRPRYSARRPARRTRLVWLESALQSHLKVTSISMAVAERPRPRGRGCPRSNGPSSWSTTPSPRRPSNVRSSSGRRHRVPLGHEIPGRSLGHDQWDGRDQPRGSASGLRFLQNAMGAVPGPLDRFPGPARPADPRPLRVERHGRNATAGGRLPAGREDVEGSATRVWPMDRGRTPRRRWRLARCAPVAVRSRSLHAPVVSTAAMPRRARSPSARPPGSSPWPSRSAEWSR